MRLLVDLLPLLLFFATYRRFGIFAATGVAIAATVGTVVWSYARKKPIQPALWVSLAVVVVFGGATIALGDETFIKWKPTVLYWLGAVALAVGEISGRSALVWLIGDQLVMPPRIWRRLAWTWVVFLLLLGALNLLVAFTCSLDTWVSFKVFGLLGIMLLFVIGQGLVLAKHIENTDKL